LSPASLNFLSRLPIWMPALEIRFSASIFASDIWHASRFAEADTVMLSSMLALIRALSEVPHLIIHLQGSRDYRSILAQLKVPQLQGLCLVDAYLAAFKPEHALLR